MPWWVYLVHVLGGAFLANGVPHFVQGASGNTFPSPFASPPGVGDSSAFVNVLWGAANFISGFVLLRLVGPFTTGDWWDLAAAAAGVLAMGARLSTHFGKVRSRK
jgi:hypothetical protein